MGSLIGGKTADRPADWTGRGGENRIETGRRERIETEYGEKRSTERKGVWREKEYGEKREHKGRNGVRIETENNGWKRGTGNDNEGWRC